MGDLPMMETWPQLYVEDADEQYALSVLARASSARAGAPWICEECKEQLEPQFTCCWRCGQRAERPDYRARRLPAFWLSDKHRHEVRAKSEPRFSAASMASTRCTGYKIDPCSV